MDGPENKTCPHRVCLFLIHACRLRQPVVTVSYAGMRAGRTRFLFRKWKLEAENRIENGIKYSTAVLSYQSIR